MTTYVATAVASTVSEAPLKTVVTIVPLMPDDIPGVVGVGVVPGERVLLPRPVTDMSNSAGEVTFSLVATADTISGPSGVGVRYRAEWGVRGADGSVEFSMPRTPIRISAQPSGITPTAVL